MDASGFHEISATTSSGSTIELGDFLVGLMKFLAFIHVYFTRYALTVTKSVRSVTSVAHSIVSQAGLLTPD